MATRPTVHLDYPPGATPLDADELASLIPGHLTTQAELNEWEQLNIVDGDKWARKQRKDILTESFLRQLHKQMFGETWRWAGDFRKSDKNIGVDWLHIGVALKKLLDDVRYQVEHGSFPADEIALRFHHRLVATTQPPSVSSGRHLDEFFCHSRRAQQRFRLRSVPSAGSNRPRHGPARMD